VACYVVEKVDDGLNWHATFETREQAQAYCDDLIAKDPAYANVIAIIEGDDPATTQA
jgi:viroplasmin and RNaseH domain-containing protein